MSRAPSARTAYAAHEGREGDEDILNIGKQCSASTCALVDFLPIKCNHCAEPFCQEHFSPDKHNCQKWDASQADRRALECPLCSTLIAIPPGEDPNIRIGHHVDTECAVMNGGAPTKAKKSTPVCAESRCDKRLWQPIECDKCHNKFCASHRYPTSHKCTPTGSSSSSSTGTLTNAMEQASAKSKAAMAALDRFKAAQTGSSGVVKKRLFAKAAPGASPSGPSTSTSESSADSKKLKAGNNPLSARDRRADQERKSKLKSMHERKEKGLLTDTELEHYDQLVAELKDKDGCKIM